MLHDREFLRRLESSKREDYDSKNHEWLVQELIMRDNQMVRLAREALEEMQQERDRARQQIQAIPGAARAWNLVLEARRRGRKTVRVSDLVGL